VTGTTGDKGDTLDVSEFEEANTKRRVACWFPLLPCTDEERDVLATMLDQRPDIKHKTISVVLANHKYKIDEGSVARHRKRECQCPKPEP